MRDINVRYFKKLYVDTSDISGQGLFAGEKIAKGEIILSFGGTLALQADRYSGKYKSSTFVGISETVMLCETSDAEKDFSDYINHSCNPNAGMLDCLSVMAVRDINEHEEIVCDYAFWEADEEWVLKKLVTVEVVTVGGVYQERIGKRLNQKMTTLNSFHHI